MSIFSIAVLAGVAWVTKQDQGGDTPIELKDLSPSLPQFRSQGRSRSESAPRSQTSDGETRFTRSHRARGAVVGHTQVYRGDLISVAGTPFRLVDINEVRSYSHCGPSMYSWPCGTTPMHALDLRIGDDQVACYNRGFNAQGEQLGQCFIENIDLGGWMVEHGMALPASNRSDYNIKRSTARREGRGWWHTQK